MKRVVTVVLGASLFLMIGCADNYERRLEHTIQKMKYQKRLDDNLTTASTKGRLEQLRIFVRPPKAMTGPTQTFQLAVIEPGKFDVEASFIEPDKQSLHVLGRVKQPKEPAKKGVPKAEPAPRGEFNTEIIEMLRSVYGAELNAGDFKEEKRGDNTFKYKLLDLNAKNVQIYLYGTKTSPYEVALIFEYPKTEHNSVNPKIGLCLEAFATGEKAKRAFTGGDVEEEAEGEQNAQPVTF